MGCFSFYANKIITTGEGGMITTNDPALADRLRLLRNLAFTEPRFRHEDAGFNFRMTGYQAAMGLSQLRRIDSIVEAKRSLARRYHEALADVPGLSLPVEMPWARNVYWMYAVVIQPDSGTTRDRVSQKLRAAGIDTRTFFCPMDLQPFLKTMPGFSAERCPVADQLWERGMYLPSSPNISDESFNRVVTALRAAVWA